MSETAATSIHASAVAVGDRAVLIRGPSGCGKSRLAFDLICTGRTGAIPPTTLIGDDRIVLSVHDGALIGTGAAKLKGMIEIRGLGVRKIDFAERGTLAVVVDLSSSDAERMPPPHATTTHILGVELPRIPVGRGHNPLPLIVAFLTTT